jgi:transcriptional regulator of nitric oxide reductase
MNNSSSIILLKEIQMPIVTLWQENRKDIFRQLQKNKTQIIMVRKWVKIFYHLRINKEITIRDISLINLAKFNKDRLMKKDLIQYKFLIKEKCLKEFFEF